jgi:hypothetical protein
MPPKVCAYDNPGHLRHFVYPEPIIKTPTNEKQTKKKKKKKKKKKNWMASPTPPKPRVAEIEVTQPIS